MPEVFLGLGSNLGHPKRQLRRAISHLRTLPRTVIKKQSSHHLTQPIGVRAQPLFYNQVIAIQTTLPPLRLLTLCQQIEKKQNRVKKKRWGARTIDIDILTYGHQRIQHRRLIVPHPEMQHRSFVMTPLNEVRTCLTTSP